jgi:hypothetical protein
MFTPDAEIPFGVHVTAANPAGFGAQRILKEVCGIDPATEAERYTAAMRRLNAELEQFDRQVLAILQTRHPELTDVTRMRAALHRAMVDALQVFARREGIVGEGESVRDFRELFDAARRMGRPLNAYQYMKEFNKILFERSLLARETTEIAVIERDRPRVDGKSHADAMTSLLGSEGARAVMYDAVAVEASRAVRSNPELRRYFSEGDGVINITQEAVSRLRDVNPELYRHFHADVVSGLVRDGGITAASH